MTGVEETVGTECFPQVAVRDLVQYPASADTGPSGPGPEGPLGEELPPTVCLAEVEDRVDDRTHVVGSQEAGQGLARSGGGSVQFAGVAAAEGIARGQEESAGPQLLLACAGACLGPSRRHPPNACRARRRARAALTQIVN
ncbi:hypothetical protein GCM10010277_79480 [Streptomyces longisporoflavus]|nr:hypothetical protein GCM10010277_79480 [Streptomyces longisporoflavus]